MSAGCRDCGRRWTSLTQAHCQMCHQHFASHALADKHHTYDERRKPTCHHPVDVLTKQRGEPVFRPVADVDGLIVWRSYATDNRWSNT